MGERESSICNSNSAHTFTCTTEKKKKKNIPQQYLWEQKA